MKVGIKYCGGCNPRYDRAASVRTLCARHPVGVRFLTRHSGRALMPLQGRRGQEGSGAPYPRLSVYSFALMAVRLCSYPESRNP